jgi:hypothetical protein
VAEVTPAQSVARELDVQRERAAMNQSLFREVNERIEDLSRSAASPSFICECADESCDASMALTLEEYERVRSDANRFAVLPGHQLAAVEEVVEGTDRYVVVAKLGVGGQVAARLDPRSRNRG